MSNECQHFTSADFLITFFLVQTISDICYVLFCKFGSDLPGSPIEFTHSFNATMTLLHIMYSERTQISHPGLRRICVDNFSYLYCVLFVI